MNRVLITGASGFIGKSCLKFLKNFDVHTTHLHTSDICEQDVTWHKIDLMDLEKTGELITRIKPTHLLHLAWFVEPGQWPMSFKNIEWLKASCNIIDNFIAAGGKRIIVSGSCSEYGPSSEPLNEDTDPIEPDTLYGITKQALHRYLSLRNISYSWARVFFVYGPNEHHNRLVPLATRSLLLNKKITLLGTGSHKRDYLHVDDVASALVNLLNSDLNGPVNIGSGHSISIKEIVDMISGKLEKPGLIKFGSPIDVTPNIEADITKISKIWKPRYPLQEGMIATIEWHKQNLMHL